MSRYDQPLEKLRTAIEKFSEYNKDTLISRDKWGTISFEEARPEFEIIFGVIGYLKILPLEVLPLNILKIIDQQVRIVTTVFDKVEKFTIEEGNPKDRKNSLVVEIQTAADNFGINVSPWIPFLAYQKGDVTKNIDKLTTSVESANMLLDKANQEIKNKSKEIEEIVDAAREASASAGAAVFTKDFSEESVNSKKSAKKWLIASAIIGGITLLFALLMWFFPEPELDAGQIWQKVGTKLAVLGLLISATFWSGKIYKAQMHQSTVNKHRSLSIQTLQAFHAAASNPNVKDAVVFEATRAVFGNLPTGYIDSNQKNDGDIKIMEIAKSVLPGDKE